MTKSIHFRNSPTLLIFCFVVPEGTCSTPDFERRI
jgi:hypothetical protein